MKLLLAPLLLVSSAFAQSKSDLPLAPFREAAHKAFTEEMAGSDQPLCPGLVPLADLSACLHALRLQSDKHLVLYRTALGSSIAIRQKLLGSQALLHFQTAERMWDSYSASQLRASGDMAGSTELVSSAAEETRM